jgi:crotonobetainyl-CoA:carnitine CoA-transferase CaiB-like acyl-CoA transferase
MNIFKNLTIIELGTVLAAPQVGQFFAELGSNVIKIENPKTGGDVSRTWKLPSESKEETRSAYFCASNWGKKSISLDITEEKQLKKLYELVKTADIVIANYKSGAAKKLAVDFETLQKINPHLIYGHITAYGTQDKRVGYDAIIQAESGFLYMNGSEGGESVKMPVALVDILAAHQLKEALLIALLEKKHTNIEDYQGEYVSVSLFDSAVASLANQATNWLTAGQIPEKKGSQHPNIVPYGNVFKTQDGEEILLAVGSDRHFKILCEILEVESLADDTRFRTNAERVKNRQIIVPILEDAFKNFSKEFLLNAFKAKQVPAGSINNMKQVFELAEAQNMILSNPDAPELRAVRTFVGSNKKDIRLTAPPFLEKK